MIVVSEKPGFTAFHFNIVNIALQTTKIPFSLHMNMNIEGQRVYQISVILYTIA